MVCTRLDFTKNIKTESHLEDIIRNYFDETMYLYNVIGDYSDFTIEGDYDKLSFDIIFTDIDHAKRLYAAIGSTERFTSYGKTFDCSIGRVDSAICILIK